MADHAANGLLEKAELFKGLPREALTAVLGGATRLPLRQGAQLLKQGDPPDHLFMVERGKVKMSVVTPEGTQLVLRFMGEGDIIGCAAVFRGLAYPASAMAAEDTSVLAWNAPHMNEFVGRFPWPCGERAQDRWWAGRRIPSTPSGGRHREGRAADCARPAPARRGSTRQLFRQSRNGNRARRLTSGSRRVCRRHALHREPHGQRLVPPRYRRRGTRAHHDPKA
jgi:hypothetical protein